MRRSELVAAYLARLGYADRPAPTLGTLVDLHVRHLDAVPYENLSIMLGRPPSVEPLDSLARIAEVGRAGYCFHQNGALEQVLLELGFQVTRRAGHVWSSEDERAPWSLNHLVLVASGLPTDANPGGSWWVDVGLGDAFVEPVALVGGPFAQGGFAYELEVPDSSPGGGGQPVQGSPVDRGSLKLSALARADNFRERPTTETLPPPGGWSFRADPSGSFVGIDVRSGPTSSEVEASHATLSTPPGHFAKVLVVQRRDWYGVDVVRGCLLHRVTAQEQTSTELTTYDEWRAAIADGCGLSLAGISDAALHDLWVRTVATHREWTAAGRP